jgi:hypothetical protein
MDREQSFDQSLTLLAVCAIPARHSTKRALPLYCKGHSTFQRFQHYLPVYQQGVELLVYSNCTALKRPSSWRAGPCVRNVFKWCVTRAVGQVQIGFMEQFKLLLYRKSQDF